jgi:serine/threonine protein kinase
LLVEFCTGGQLLERLRGERRMCERDVSAIIKQVCEGVDYIHKEQIIHRDIKPENILFNFGVVKISDFGWAVFSGMGMRKTASGSPLYYPPEIVKGEQYDDKIDVWSIGMMTYECLLGKIPFKVYSEFDLGRIVSVPLCVGLG